MADHSPETPQSSHPAAAAQADWFRNWFNSPYYHILYRHRDEHEAQQFLNALTHHLHIRPGQRVLDVACGRGRHAIYLHQLGFEVEGLDLSEDNIAYAQQFTRPGLRFTQHDMREPFRQAAFDYTLNLFTSFGYFASEAEHQAAINMMAGSLTPGGWLVLDFFNTRLVIDQLIHHETRHAQGITFHLQRQVTDGYIVKTISFADRGQKYQFQERVKALTEADFRSYFQQAGLTLHAICGSYRMGQFVPTTSERMIFLLQREAH